jgi:hypothetical protein
MKNSNFACTQAIKITSELNAPNSDIFLSPIGGSDAE